MSHKDLLYQELMLIIVYVRIMVFLLLLLSYMCALCPCITVLCLGSVLFYTLYISQRIIWTCSLDKLSSFISCGWMEFWVLTRSQAYSLFFFLLLSTLGSVNIIAKNQNICFLVQQLTTLAVAASLLATSPARASSLDSCIAFPSRKCGSPLRPCSASTTWAFLR